MFIPSLIDKPTGLWQSSRPSGLLIADNRFQMRTHVIEERCKYDLPLPFSEARKTIALVHLLSLYNTCFVANDSLSCHVCQVRTLYTIMHCFTGTALNFPLQKKRPNVMPIHHELRG